MDFIISTQKNISHCSYSFRMEFWHAKCWEKVPEVLRHTSQPHATTRHGSQVSTELSCWVLPGDMNVVPIWFWTSMYMEEWVHILPSWFGLTKNFTLKMETVARGWAGRGAQQSCASGFTVQWVLNLEFWNVENMFLNSFTTYNLYIKKMKTYLKIWLGGRLDSLEQFWLQIYNWSTSWPITFMEII